METVDSLRSCTLAELERIFREAPLGPRPSGRFEGEVLHRVDAAATRPTPERWVIVPFERLRFGIDFDRRVWFFVHPRLRVGRFRVEAGRSRWRDAKTLRLRYDVSRLPVRGHLYDEVKPLSADLCLGLGGLERGEGEGDLFFFLLRRAG